MATAEREEENEVILFQRPDHVLFVWGLPESLSWESKWSQLVEAFRIYGLLHAVHVPPDEKQVCYAFIKYYSSKASNRALLNTDKKLSIGGSLLKVKFSDVEPSLQQQQASYPLHISKCYELANYYLTYNGWNVKIMSVENDRQKCLCTVQLEVKKPHLLVIGKGIHEFDLTFKAGAAKKVSFHKACENAFSKIAIRLLPGGPGRGNCIMIEKNTDD